MPDAAAVMTANTRNLPQEDFDAFFSEGGLTVYTSAPSPWRWLICAGQKSQEATVVDIESLLEKTSSPLPAHETTPTPQDVPHSKKPFEQSTLVQWLTRATQKQASGDILFSKLAEEEDIEAFLKLVHFSRADWDSLNALPSLTAAEIRHFEQSHNAALSDIENAFLPARIDLPPALATFYINHLVRARRDVEATLIIAQATHSTRLPRLISDALAVGAFEGAGLEPLKFEGNDYAVTTIQDTTRFVDAAMTLAARKLALPIDHDGHLLRMSVMDMTRLAADIVEENRPAPFAFLLKAREMFTGRCDVCRFPPLQRFAIAVAERDVNVEESWVQRMALAYERLFEGRATYTAEETPTKEARIIAFSR